jgi:uncharacterized protein (TIGR02646 family)
MIEQIAATYVYSPQEAQDLNYVIGGGFDWGDNDPILIRLKTNIRRFLDNIQSGKCCYCGRLLVLSEVDHIAPKGRYPDFLFEPENLALSCKDCNSLERKGSTNTIKVHDPHYRNCTFLLVHPYRDDPKAHYKLDDQVIKIFIQPITDEGVFSVNLFGLNEEAHSILRAQQKQYEDLVARFNISQARKEEIDHISEYKPQ